MRKYIIYFDDGYIDDRGNCVTPDEALDIYEDTFWLEDDAPSRDPDGSWRLPVWGFAPTEEKTVVGSLCWED